MSRYATIALCEIENFVGHATAHLDAEDQIEVYEHLIVSWQNTVREIRAEKETPPAPMCGFCRLIPCICISAPNR